MCFELYQRKLYFYSTHCDNFVSSFVIFLCLYYFMTEVIPISIKNDIVLSYIEQLPEGAKVSVRELSTLLHVSEGTAYKAVKEAELRGLVMVKPKAGTVRISTEQPAFEKAVNAVELTRTLGLSVVSGREKLSQNIKKLVICDGSEQAMLRQLDGEEPEACLCLCGDRPELQTCVLEHGANLLLTGGAKASWMQMSLAEKSGLLILATPQSTYSVVRLFDEEFVGRDDFSGSSHISAWMQTPDYLYYNDIIADWQQLYVDSSLPKQYPVVDDDLALCGGIDMWKGAAAVPSQKVRSVMAEQMSVPTVSAADDMKDIAKRFVINGESLAAVVDDGQMVGIVTANDLLRYYMYTEPNSYEYAAKAFLEIDASVSGADTMVYRIRIPESEMQNINHTEMALLLSAAGNHLREFGCEKYKLESGTFFAPNKISSSEGLLLTSRLSRMSQSTFAIEAEINDDTASYAKVILIASRLDDIKGD